MIIYEKGWVGVVRFSVRVIMDVQQRQRALFRISSNILALIKGPGWFREGGEGGCPICAALGLVSRGQDRVRVGAVDRCCHK